MRHRHIILHLLILTTLTLSGCHPLLTPLESSLEVVPPAATPTLTITPIILDQVIQEIDEITSDALAGNLIDDRATRNFIVLLPPTYESSNQRYPVVYVLPWGASHPNSNVSGFEMAIEALLRNDEAREMILVFADGSNKFGASLFRSSPTIGDYETYLVRELVEAVDSQYRTLGTRARAAALPVAATAVTPPCALR